MSIEAQGKRANLEGTFAGAFNSFLLQALSKAVKFSILLAIALPLWGYFVEGQATFEVFEILGYATGFSTLNAFFDVLLPWLQKNEPNDPVAAGAKAVLANRESVAEAAQKEER